MAQPLPVVGQQSLAFHDSMTTTVLPDTPNRKHLNHGGLTVRPSTLTSNATLILQTMRADELAASQAAGGSGAASRTSTAQSSNPPASAAQSSRASSEPENTFLDSSTFIADHKHSVIETGKDISCLLKRPWWG